MFKKALALSSNKKVSFAELLDKTNSFLDVLDKLCPYEDLKPIYLDYSREYRKGISAGLTWDRDFENPFVDEREPVSAAKDFFNRSVSDVLKQYQDTHLQKDCYEIIRRYDDYSDYLNEIGEHSEAISAFRSSLEYSKNYVMLQEQDSLDLLRSEAYHAQLLLKLAHLLWASEQYENALAEFESTAEYCNKAQREFFPSLKILTPEMTYFWSVLTNTRIEAVFQFKTKKKQLRSILRSKIFSRIFKKK